MLVNKRASRDNEVANDANWGKVGGGGDLFFYRMRMLVNKQPSREQEVGNEACRENKTCLLPCAGCWQQVDEPQGRRLQTK